MSQSFGLFLTLDCEILYTDTYPGSLIPLYSILILCLPGLYLPAVFVSHVPLSVNRSLLTFSYTSCSFQIALSFSPFNGTIQFDLLLVSPRNSVSASFNAADTQRENVQCERLEKLLLWFQWIWEVFVVYNCRQSMSLRSDERATDSAGRRAVGRWARGQRACHRARVDRHYPDRHTLFRARDKWPCNWGG